jgi:hypothetical protein
MQGAEYVFERFTDRARKVLCWPKNKRVCSTTATSASSTFATSVVRRCPAPSAYREPRPRLLERLAQELTPVMARYGYARIDVAQEDAVVRIVLANGSCETIDTFFVTTMWTDRCVRRSRPIPDRPP